MTDSETSDSVPFAQSGEPNALPTPKARSPWLTYFAVVVSILIFAALTYAGRAAQSDLEFLSRLGYSPAADVWRGAYWTLVSSVFVHIEIWHLAFNVYWLWRLGRPMETALGTGLFAAFFLMAAVVSSAMQLAVSDDTGIGASGVGYAIFGFMWTTRDRYPQFNSVINLRIFQLFMMWLIGCLIATHLGIWAVGNAAHVAGLFFGVLVGHLAWKRRRLFALAGLLLLILASLVPLAWAPWSVTWLSIKAYDAHLAGDHHRALEWYNRILRRDPENAWAYINRSGVYEALGDKKLAEEDRAMAIKLNPDYGRMN